MVWGSHLYTAVCVMAPYYHSLLCSYIMALCAVTYYTILDYSLVPSIFCIYLYCVTACSTILLHRISSHLISQLCRSPPLTGHESMGSGSSPFGARDGTKETWNLSLYHGGSVLSESELLEGKKACFDCLLKQILAVWGTPGNIGGAVIAPGDEVIALLLCSSFWLAACTSLFACVSVCVSACVVMSSSFRILSDVIVLS